MNNPDTIESRYNEGLISPGEALNALMNIYLMDRSNEPALDVMCSVIIDLTRVENKAADERWARIGV